MRKRIIHWHWYGVILLIVALVIMGKMGLTQINYNTYFIITLVLVMLVVLALWRFSGKS